MILPLFAFLLALLVGQILSHRARAWLSTEEKALLADEWAGRGAWPLITIAVLSGLQALVSHLLGHHRWLLPVFVVALLATSIGFMVADHRRLSRLGLPVGYVRSDRNAQILVLVGLLVTFGALVRESMEMHRKLDRIHALSKSLR